MAAGILLKDRRPSVAGRVMSVWARLLIVLPMALSVGVTAADRKERRESRPPVAALGSVEFAGGDGSGCDRAVVIRGSRGSRDIVANEMAWLRTRYPGYKYSDNTVETRGARTFEEVTIETAAGERKVVCFDVTEGFGRF